MKWEIRGVLLLGSRCLPFRTCMILATVHVHYNRHSKLKGSDVRNIRIRGKEGEL